MLILRRTFYDGKHMYSRLGNPFSPPQWFLDSALLYFILVYGLSKHLPELPKDVTLDGELFGGRAKFQDTVSIVKTVNSPHWQGITFKV